MNRIDPLVSHADTPEPRPRSVRRFYTNLKKVLNSSDLLRALLSKAFSPSDQDRIWMVKGRLVMDASFAILTIETSFRISAATKFGALRFAANEIRRSHPWYSISALTAEKEQASIGHNLHDGVGQMMTGVASPMEGLEEE